VTELPEATSDLLFLALDHGIDSVRSGGPLIPFVIAERDGERALTRFAHETLEGGLAAGLAAVKREPPGPDQRSVLVYDGYLTTPDGVRLDAIYAEALESDGTITVMAQRYKPGKLLRRFETVGNAALLPSDWSKLGDA
jgi:hypothetical protein